MVAGTGRLLDAIEAFRFGPDELAFLARRGHAWTTLDALAFLESGRFTGDIDGYPEGELYFPARPF